MSDVGEALVSLAAKVGRMRKRPTWIEGQATRLPGEWPSDDGSTFLVSDDPLWKKVDAEIVKVLRSLKKSGIQKPLAALQEAALDAEHGEEPDPSMVLLSCRLLDTRLKADSLSRIAQVASGNDVAMLSHDRALGEPKTVLPLLKAELVKRGILMPKK